MNEFAENFERFLVEENLTRTEGVKGVMNLAKITNALGYKDPAYFGQFAGGCYGDLIVFFEDNPGAIEAVVDWIRNNGDEIEEWKENISYDKD